MYHGERECQSTYPRSSDVISSPNTLLTNSTATRETHQSSQINSGEPLQTNYCPEDTSADSTSLLPSASNSHDNITATNTTADTEVTQPNTTRIPRMLKRLMPHNKPGTKE